MGMICNWFSFTRWIRDIPQITRKHSSPGTKTFLKQCISWPTKFIFDLLDNWYAQSFYLFKKEPNQIKYLKRSKEFSEKKNNSASKLTEDRCITRDFCDSYIDLTLQCMLPEKEGMLTQVYKSACFMHAWKKNKGISEMFDLWWPINGYYLVIYVNLHFLQMFLRDCALQEIHASQVYNSINSFCILGFWHA